MIKTGKNDQNYYHDNIRHIKVNKKSQNNESKNNSLPHQENNYYYNTKINRLILQEAPNNNRIQNIYPHSGITNKNIYIDYDILANNLNNVNNINNIISQKRPIQSLYKKTTNYQRLPITVKKINENEIHDNFNKDINGFNYVNINRNINPNNLIQSSRVYYNNNNKNNINFYKIYGEENSSQRRHNDNLIGNEYANLSQRNTNYYFNNLDNINKRYNQNYNYMQTNVDLNNNSSNNPNKSANCKKIPIRQEKIGKYFIRNPGMPDPSRTNFSLNKKNNYKNRYKSPEIKLVKNKLEKNNYSTIQNDKSNEDINKKVYSSGFGFYKKKDEINNNCNNNNIIVQKINSSEKLNKNNNQCKAIENKNNLNIINISNDLYEKIPAKNINIYEISGKTDDSSNKDNKMSNINNFKNYIKNELTDYNSIKKTIEEFCEILEQFYYISFKKSYEYFIQNLMLYNNKNSKRNIILRRFNDDKKSNKTNHIKINQSTTINNNIKFLQNERINTIDNENIKKDIQIENYISKRKNKSPSKFIELQNNISNSMMKINQDNYIKIFNNLFRKKGEIDKRCKSPLIKTGNSDIRMTNNSIKSFDYGGEIEKEAIYDKYNTNTNVNLCFQKKNLNKYNLKINTEYLRQSCDNNNKENILIKRNLKDSINVLYTDDNNKIIKRENSFKFKNNNFDLINKLNNTENNNIFDTDENNNRKGFAEGEKLYYDENNIFQKQKYKISNTLEPPLLYKSIKKINNINEIQRNDPESKIYIQLNTNNDKNNNILYSKPLLKKMKTKYIEQDQNNKNMSALEAGPCGRYSHVPNNNMLDRSLNMSRSPYNTEMKLFLDEQINNYDINEFILNEIIVKNVSTEDKRLNVFIKYITLENYPNKNRDRLLSKLLNINKNNKKDDNFDINKFKWKHTDSICFIIKNNKKQKKKNNFNKKLSKKNIIYEKNNWDNCRYYNEHEEEGEVEVENLPSPRNDKVKEGDEKITKNNRHKVLTSIGEEEDEKTKNQLSINYNNLEEEINNNKNKKYINEELKNSIIYLMSVLQNKYDDNKKSILYNFFKNLRRIKTNSLLFNSKKFKKNISKNNNRYYNDNNINKFEKIKKKQIKEYDLNNTNTDINIKRNLKNSIKEKDNIYNNTEDIIINKSYNKLNNYISFNNNENPLAKSRKEDLLGSIKKLKDEAIKIKNFKSESNLSSKNSKEKVNNNINKENNKKDDEEKEIMKKKKLAKLGKLFNNLNQENNIINAIKEQFLNWTNNNDFSSKKLENKENRKEYGLKTFDMKYMFTNESNNKGINKDKITYNEFEKKINMFKNKIISYCFKNVSIEKKNKSEMESIDEKEIRKTYERDSENSYENENKQSIGKYEIGRKKNIKNRYENKKIYKKEEEEEEEENEEEDKK